MPTVSSFDRITNAENIFSISSLQAIADKLTILAAIALKDLLPKAFFCWLARNVHQIQFLLNPKKYSYWSKLSDEIYLGAIPLRNWDHVNLISKLGVNAVLSINKKHEFRGRPYSHPVSPNEWKKKKIDFLRISCPDLDHLTVTQLAKAVDYVVSQASQGKRVYIHCTGGKGRSVSVAICALIKLKRLTLEESIQHVRKFRPQMMLTQGQKDSLILWHQNLKK